MQSLAASNAQRHVNNDRNDVETTNFLTADQAAETVSYGLSV